MAGNTTVENEISITLLNNVANSNEERRNFIVWKPYMLKFCRDNGLKNIFVGHGDYVAITKPDSLYVFVSHRDLYFERLLVKKMRNINLTDSQLQSYFGQGNNLCQSIQFKDTLRGNAICHYIHSINTFSISDLCHLSEGVTILDDITESIKEGNMMLGIDNLNMSVTVNIIKEETLKPHIDAVIRNLNLSFKDSLNKMQESNKKYLEAVESSRISIPVGITDANVRYCKFSRSGCNGLGIMYPFRFKISRIIRGDKQFDVSALTKFHDVMVCVIVDGNFMLKSIKLYKRSMVKEFCHLHRRECNYDGSNEICLGTYQDSLFKIKLDNNDALYKVKDIVKEIISSATYGEIAGNSTDMDDDYKIYLKIGNNDPEMDKYMIGEAWTVKDEHKTTQNTTASTSTW